MVKKYKILLVMFIVAMVLFSSGITYSIFTSSSNLSVDQEIASFIFEAEKQDHLELNLTDLRPGVSEEYNFSVANNASNNVSDVTIEYKIIIKTFHFMPLNIELYKIGDEEELIMRCDESYNRNANNHLVCNSSIQVMEYSKEMNDNYKLKVTFEDAYNNEMYAELVDFIDLEINSWQKMKD